MPPWRRLPAESLYLPGAGVLVATRDAESARPSAEPVVSVSSSSGGGATNNLARSGELDEEVARRIMEYIYRYEDGSVIRGGDDDDEEEDDYDADDGYNDAAERKERKNPRAVRALDPSGHPSAFFIPRNNSSGSNTSGGGGAKQGVDLLAKVSDKLGLVTRRNMQQIDRDLLIKYGLTLRVLIEKIRASISDFVAPRILCNFEDLRALGFVPQDLVRDRTRFNCQQLRQLFHADFATIRAAGIDFSLHHLLQYDFTSSELITLKFSFHTLVRERGINWKQLRDLNFPLDELVQMDLRQEDLERLNVDEGLALAPRPDGLGWPRELYRSYFPAPRRNKK